MPVFSLRCRNWPCRHRRQSKIHPDEYTVIPACKVCGSRKGWRVENQAFDPRPLCDCGGVVQLSTKNNVRAVRHKTDHPFCLSTSEGHKNHLRKAGYKESELFDLLPLDKLGKEMKSDEPCPF